MKLKIKLLLPFFFVGITIIYGQNIPLSQFPSVQKVIEDTNGKDKVDANLKQAGTLRLLAYIVKVADGDAYNEATSSQELALFDGYMKKSDELYQSATKRIRQLYKGEELEKQLLYAENKYSMTYFSSKDFRPVIYRKYFKGYSESTFEPSVTNMMLYGTNPPQSESEEEDTVPFAQLLTGLIKIEIICFLVFAGIVVLVVRANRRRKYGLDPQDRSVFWAGRAKYEVHTFTGTVMDSSSTVETTRTTYTDRNNQSAVSYHSSDHDKFFVQDFDSKREHDVHLVNSGIMLRPGHVLSAIWLIREGNTLGSYVVFFNHITRKTTLREEAMKANIKPNMSLFFPLAIMLFFLTDIVGRLYFPMYVGHQNGVLYGFQAFVTFILLIVLWYSANSKKNRVLRNFFQQEVPEIIQRLDKKFEQHTRGN